MVTRGLRIILGYTEKNPSTRIIVDAVALLLVAALAVLIYRGAAAESRAANQGKQAHDYLCYQKLIGIPKQIRQANEAIDASLKYQTDVQLGFRKPVPGISEADIERGIAARQADIDRLNDTLIRGLSKVICNPTNQSGGRQ